MENKKLLKHDDPTDWAALIRQGDNRTLSAIHGMYKVKLYYYVRRLLDRPDEVEDIVSDTFIALWQSRSKMFSNTHIRNFLFITAHNKTINLLKSNTRKMVGYNEMEIPDAPLIDIMEMEWAQVEMMAQLKQAIASLSTEYRQVFELYFEKELNTGEIARILNTTPGTVRSQKKRALEIIRKWIKKNELLIITTICFLSGYLAGQKKILPFLPHYATHVVFNMLS